MDAEARLRARNAELAAWADRAGHDLMTPLAIISGMAETLDGAWERLDATDRARLLTSIRTQASRATAMLEEVLALTRASSAPSEEPPAPS
jgi:K+-sensing histidine kinase KdpD